MNTPALLTPPEAAEFLRTTAKTLSVWRSTGRHGIPFVKAGRKIWYDRAALVRFLAKQTVNGDDQEAGA